MVLLHLFHNQGRGQPIGGIARIRWLLNDSFNDTLVAGAVNGTPATPGPGTRVVMDTGSDLTLSGGNLVTSGRTGTGDPALWLDGVTRIAGQLVISHLNRSNTGNRQQVGFDDNQIGTLNDVMLDFEATNIRAGTIIVGTNAASRDYYIAIILKSTGGYLFVKEATGYPNWTLLWIETTKTNDPVYLGHSVRTAWGAGNNTSSFLRVPQELWLPTPLAYTLFAGANGTSLDALDTLTTGPDSQGCTAKAWTEESGDWDIQSNKANPDGAAIATVDAGQADIVVDLTIDGGTAGQPAICLRFADTNNYWFLQADRANNQFELHEYNATVDTVRASAAVTFNDSTDYDLRAICDGQVIDGFADGANKISYGSAALNETETEHGLYADHTECEFDDFLIFARDSGFSQLDEWI